MKNFGRQQWKEGPIIPFLPAIASGVSIIAGVKGLLAKAPSAKDAPQVSAPTVMPTQDSQSVLDAKRKAAMGNMARGGRASTILSDNSDSSQTFGGS